METIYVLIKVETDHLEIVAEQVREIEGVETVDIVTGSYDIIAQITGADVGKMLSRVVSEVRAIKGISSTETLIALSME